MTFPDQILTEQQRQLEQARTSNEVAAVLYPEAAQSNTAFLEATENPLDMFPSLRIVDLQDDFWARTLAHTVYATSENQFLQYKADTGLYEPIPDTTLIGQIYTNLNVCAKHLQSSQKHDLLALLKNRQRLRAVVVRAKDLLAVDVEQFFKPQSRHTIYVANGILNILSPKLTPFSPNIHIRHKLPVKFDPDARCEKFSDLFLKHVLRAEDIDLLQRYLSQILLGKNLSQKILVLVGFSGWGKSTLMKVLGAMLGWHRVGIIRDQLYCNAYEISRYANRHFLYHPDMPTQFLNHKAASVFKQLVGGDPLWAESRSSDEMMTIEGNFPVVLACNGIPQVSIDQDVDAWTRRLAVVTFGRPAHDTHIGLLSEWLIALELPGILNWLIDGYQKLMKSRMQLEQTPDQRALTALLLMASESPAAYVRSALVKKPGAVMGSAELYENYQSWCRQHHLQPFAAMKFHQIAKAEMETALGLKYRHDLPSDTGGFKRGWKGLALFEMDETENAKKASEESGKQVVVAE